MGHPGSSFKLSSPVVADASLWIALAATGCAAELVVALGQPTVITAIARAELERGRPKGRNAAEIVDGLIASGHVEVVSLTTAALEIYSGLVIGEGFATLDDGEAATLALADALGGTAVIDERKARRIAFDRFPNVRLWSSAELFLAPQVIGVLGKARCVDALFAAIQMTRLRVPPEAIKLVVEALGDERARHCPSLPASTRTYR